MGEVNERATGNAAQPNKQGRNTVSNIRRRKPHFKSASAAPDGSGRSLAGPPVSRRVSLTLHEGGLNGKSGAAKLSGGSFFAHNEVRIANYLKWLAEGGLSLPENPNRRGEIFFPQVEVEAGLSRNTLNLNKTDELKSDRIHLREMLNSGIPQLGVGVRVLPQSPGQKEAHITFERMLEEGRKERKIELNSKSNTDQQCYNTTSALRLFLRTLGLKASDSVGAEFVTEFRCHVEQVTGKIKNLGSRRKFQTEIHWWHRFYQRLIKEQAIPEDFHRAVAYLSSRSGLPLKLLADLIGVSSGTLKNWCDGQVTPSPRSHVVITSMELLFKLPSGTLTNKISWGGTNKRVLLSQMPDFLRRNASLAGKVAAHLPDNFCELPTERQEEIVRSIENEILRSDDPFSEKIRELRKLPYRLKAWPKGLEEEFENLAAFMTGVRPPLGMKRNDKWRTTTKEKVRKDLAFLFGAISLPTDGEDRGLSGLGVPAEHLSLALITCPLVLDWYIRFKASRTQYTVYMISQLEIFRAMLRPGTGWVRQQPRLASKLRPINVNGTQVVPEELILRAQADWGSVCDEAREHYKHLIKELGPLISVARDPFYRIRGILEMKSPLSAFKLIADGMINDLPNRTTQPRWYHTAVRDRTIVLLFAVTGFRLRTMTQLNYTGDERGHLLPCKRGYELRVPRALFKEEESPFFGSRAARTDYVMRLPNVFGLHELLKEYLKVSCPWLMNNVHQSCSEHPLFPSSSARRSTRLGEFAIYQIYRKAFVKYVVENRWRGTGIAGVRVTGSHSARHIRATDVMKKTRSFQLAADSIHNSELMAKKHYAMFTGTDRNEHVNETLFGRTKKSDEDQEEEEEEES